MKNGNPNPTVVDKSWKKYEGDGRIENIEYRVEGNFLMLRVNLDAKTTPSYSGKSDVLATAGQYGVKLPPQKTGKTEDLTVKINAYFSVPKEVKTKRVTEAKIKALKAKLEKMNDS